MWVLMILLFVTTDVIVHSAGVVFETDFQFQLLQTCTTGLYENDVDSTDYMQLKNNVETGVRNLYKNYTGYYSASVRQFYCYDDDNLSLFVNVIIKTTSNGSFNAVINPLLNDLQDGLLSGPNIPTGKVISKAGVVYDHNPTIYASLKTEILAHHFCESRGDFKRNLASYIISADGLGTEDPSQIFYSSHQCNKISERFKKAEVRFYVSAKGGVKPDPQLTELAYKLIDQMIYDGSTWKLGLGLHHAVDSVSLDGSAAPTDDDLTDLEIIYIGVGSVVALLLLIIIIILIVNCFCHCCDDQSNKDNISYKTNVDSYELDSYDNHNTVPSEDIERGYTNPVYAQEKPKIDNSLVIHFQQDEVDHMPPPSYNSTTRKVEFEEPFESVPPVVCVDQVQSAPNLDEPVEILPNPDEPVEILPNPDEPVEIVPHHYEPMEIVPNHDEPVESVPNYTETPQVDLFIRSSDVVLQDSDSSNEEIHGEELRLDDLLTKQNDPSTVNIEYDSISRRMPTALIYPSEVAEKNREADIFPWPENRVMLSMQNNDHISDYINASYVKSVNGEVAYIATQGPLKNTVNDFWKMVWEQESKVVVMVTPLSVHGKESCYQYWPSDSVARHYGQVTVQLKTKELKPDFIITTVTLTYKGEVRQVRVFRYMSWPQDVGIPDSAKSTLVFLFEVHGSIDGLKDKRPIIHGSNAIGMAAVLIAINEAVSLLEKGKSINVKQIVSNMRKDLAGAVENHAQYQFIYEVLYQYAVYLKANI